MTVEKIASLSYNIRFLIHFWSSSTKMKCGNSLYHPLQQAKLWLFSTTQLCQKCLVHCYEMRCNSSIFHNLCLSHLNNVCATSFCLFILFMGFSRQEYGSDLPFPSPVDHILSELSTMTCPSWVALNGLAHSFSELDKAVIHVISLVNFLWLWFSFCWPSDG